MDFEVGEYFNYKVVHKVVRKVVRKVDQNHFARTKQ